MAALIATLARSAKKRTHSRRNRAVVLGLDLFRNLITQLKEKSDDCDFLFIVIITYTMAVYMGYMLHNTRKMVFSLLETKQKAHEKDSNKRGDQGGRMVDGGGEKKIAFAWLLCKATCEQYYIMPQEPLREKLAGRIYGNEWILKMDFCFAKLYLRWAVLASIVLVLVFFLFAS